MPKTNAFRIALQSNQVCDRVILFLLRFCVSQVRRKNKDAPNLGHPTVVQKQTVKELAGKLCLRSGDCFV
jgi:hypothetical protein